MRDMLAFWGILTIILLLFAIMSKRLSALVALIAIPVLTGLAAGFDTELFGFMTAGIRTIAPTGVMFIFAILFFGILTDAGTFRPVIDRLLRLAGRDPSRIMVATALLAMLVHLDGSGAVTFLVTVPALLPVYQALNLPRTALATLVALGAGTMNILPWGGPTIRAASALEVPVTELFNPMLVPVLAGLVFVLLIAYRMGRKFTKVERVADGNAAERPESRVDPDRSLERPRLFGLNIALILLAVISLISGWIPPHLVFMLAFALAVTLNYPDMKLQAARINAHAPAALLMAGILFAAGCFTGILKESGMIDAMAQSVVAFLPESVGGRLPVITGVFSMPASLVFDPDSFYFGILPLLGTTAEHFGVEAIEVGRAAISGQMTTGFPVSPLTGSTYLLVGLTGIDLGDHQRKTIPYAFATTLVILITALLVGAIPW